MYPDLPLINNVSNFMVYHRKVIRAIVGSVHESTVRPYVKHKWSLIIDFSIILKMLQKYTNFK